MSHTASLEQYFITHFTGHFDACPGHEETLRKIAQDPETLWNWFYEGDTETCLHTNQGHGLMWADWELFQAMRANINLDGIWRACSRYANTH